MSPSVFNTKISNDLSKRPTKRTKIENDLKVNYGVVLPDHCSYPIAQGARFHPSQLPYPHLQLPQKRLL